jgi:hypothetical protein
MPAKKKAGTTEKQENNKETLIEEIEETSNDKASKRKPSIKSSEPAKTARKAEMTILSENKNSLSAASQSVSGKRFSYNGMDFIALEERDNGVLVISAHILNDRMRFSDSCDPGSNDWRKSQLRKKLNTEYVKNFNANDLIPIVSDLTADTGEDNYGTCDDYIAIPSDEMFRRFNTIIPPYNTWVWSITPWAIEYSNTIAVSARTQAKTIYSEKPNRELGVAIVCVFKKDVVI